LPFHLLVIFKDRQGESLMKVIKSSRAPETNIKAINVLCVQQQQQSVKGIIYVCFCVQGKPASLIAMRKEEKYKKNSVYCERASSSLVN